MKRQGKCGSCYAFSTADLVAAQYQIDRRLKGPFELAPQFLIDCAKSPAGLGCDGGRPIEVLRNLTQCTASSGCNFPLETCYGYKEQKGVCMNQPCQSSPIVKVRKIFYLKKIHK
uniref:Peptidase C1A papain C-terminal domain-containing protein n=1 Tax=Romanomermis culicivorax TaxID=13658 RepID=A0A915J9I3_ROMCU